MKGEHFNQVGNDVLKRRKFPIARLAAKEKVNKRMFKATVNLTWALTDTRAPQPAQVLFKP